MSCRMAEQNCVGAPRYERLETGDWREFEKSEKEKIEGRHETKKGAERSYLIGQCEMRGSTGVCG
jgi:hypothetical protein